MERSAMTLARLVGRALFADGAIRPAELAIGIALVIGNGGRGWFSWRPWPPG
jgi:hypothetical protein